MQPSERYVFEDVNDGGFHYKRTVQNVGSIFPLFSSLDLSIAYTLPQNENYRSLTPMLLPKTMPQRGYTKGDYFQNHYYNSSSHTSQSWSTLGEIIGNNADDLSAVIYWAFSDSRKRYYFNGNEGNATIGDNDFKLVSGFDVSHVIFQANLKGYTKASYDTWKSNGTTPSEIDIKLSDIMENPNDYYISRFGADAVVCWDSDNNVWDALPDITPIVMVDGGGLIQGFENLNYIFGLTMGIGSDHSGGINSDTYHLYSNTEHYRITDSTQYIRKGGVPVGLVSTNSYGIGHAPSDWRIKPTWTYQECQDYQDATTVGQSNQTLNPGAVYANEFVEMWGYDLYSISQNYNNPPQGQFHFSKFDKKLSYVIPSGVISAFLASIGVYFWIDGTNANLNNLLNEDEITPDTLSHVEDIALGIMSDDGTTPGTWIVGEEIDDYEGINKSGSIVHPNFNPSPNPPSGGGDELLDMASRGQFYGSGLTKYYVDPPAAKLQKALGSWDNIATGKDVLKNLLSYKILCFPSTTFSNGVNDPFVIAGVELHDENDAVITAKRLTSTGAINLPAIPIPRTFNDFRDYAPYTTLQMFVPLCGWVTLPPWCMGRTIAGEMYINPYSGTVRCLVRADGNVVAEMGGNAAIDLPFNAEAVGMKTAAVISSILNTAGAVGSAIAMPNVSSISNVGSAALGTVCALNANYTESKGSMGDGSNVYGLYNVYIKITRPATIDENGNDVKTITNQYKHDHGIPCAKSLTLASGDGYTQVLDANIEGSMTDREKQMIIDGFRHGLIL